MIFVGCIMPGVDVLVVFDALVCVGGLVVCGLCLVVVGFGLFGF